MLNLLELAKILKKLYRWIWDQARQYSYQIHLVLLAPSNSCSLYIILY